MAKLPLGAVIREPGNTRTSNMTGWRTKMPIIASDKNTDKRLELAWLRCPDSAIYKEGDKFKINFQHCKGCGICAKVCPDIIKMVEVKQ